MTRYDRDHFSHRGRGLLLLGAIWVMVGAATLWGDPARLVVAPPLAWVPAWVRAVMWFTSGSIAIVAALRGVRRESTKWAFVALVLPASLRMVSYGVDFVRAVVTGHGGIFSWVGAIAWLLVVLVVLHEASTPVLPARLRRQS